MAKRKSNRAARRLLGVTAWNCLRISNRRLLHIYSGKQHIKPSRSQRRAKRLVEDMRIERHFEANCLAGMNDDLAWAEAVKAVKG